MKRYAIVRNARSRREAEAYLPDNYRLIHGTHEDGRSWNWLFVIEGEDAAGWTLDYVKGRYASGLIWAEEIDLSHPIMREIELEPSPSDPRPDPRTHPEYWTE